ncbi:MAG: NADPH-dependent 7-cyano-7-deazaguanine reductase QueF [Deltaproteobacteria bacterium GWA2_38_16]|nr:MAG: NADPH-dependent 7-cyano-7-deazaguanine reductase QueF [Deltaproteobacteria bacterium GWA2_38_16]OGQ02164.1 MAG: NADPH-dependent 7-cyano-7-deazaguanine reductase QueF [Deltaproteobacteria bacterium RIFCSPHIGHO2_02_FULL_38_15]OGQ34489.1 MAG: NADPH-dependent 7-cyano-7-deazaguanine reductase QueF [Deltaproteobacteria bacterium RIFCSPLOWO2_01_FULL_38_9]OGQ60661.1 MAG: NADPH-dependent 7-cyano-7-deazaguanine reductase QueF [Deltaproteobacteria bacterium RIFCSPLOWO2_12_FULL_38_8]HBQ21957.1 NADP
MSGYTERHAKSGLKIKLPSLDTFPNQFQGYEITISYPEFTSICPKTGLPDFGTIHIKYMPHQQCLELKSLKLYLLSYRNVGIFYENVVNRILQDLVKASKPKWMIVKGIFNARGGMLGVAQTHYGKIPSNVCFNSSDLKQ